MAYKPDYSKDLFRQVQDMIKKCDDLSSEIKEERKKSKKEKQELNEKIEKLEGNIRFKNVDFSYTEDKEIVDIYETKCYN